MNLLTPADELLSQFSQTLCKEKDDAVTARKGAGLDDIWQSAREQYAGVDEVNRGRGQFQKSETMSGPISVMGKVDEEARSTVFVNITRPYCDAGTARVADILLPAGRLPFDLLPTPVSDSAALAELVSEFPEIAELPVVAEKLMMQQQTEGSIAAAKKLLDDWLIEAKWPSVVREQIVETGKVGTGVMKGPFSRSRQVSEDVKGLISMIPLLYPDDPARQNILLQTIKARLYYQPGCESVKVENCFPDPTCGSNIQNGKYFWEKVPDVTERQLVALKEDSSYFPEQIAACVEEGPREYKGDGKKKKGYVLWIRTGELDLSEFSGELEGMEEMGLSCGDTVFAQAVFCNERLIKLNQMPLNSQVFPYWFMVWEPREGSWAGIGIPEQIETPQRGLNASVRALMDNMAYSVGPQVLERDGLIEPKDGASWKMHPYKHWKVLADTLSTLTSSELDPKMAMQFLEFPNYLDKIMPVIQFWLKMAEDTTGLPLLLQGQGSTDVLGISQQLMNNSTTNLRLRVKYWDDNVCKPFIDALYEWAQLYGPSSVKGDAVARSLGSSVLLQKELQQQALLQIGDRVLQPIYGKSPSKWMDMFLEGFQIDPRSLDLTEEEKAQLQAAQDAPDPKVVSAEIEAQVSKYKADLEDEFRQLKLAVDAQLKAASIRQASDAVDTQSATNIATSAMKNETAPKKAPEPEREPTVDEAAAILGIE